MRHSTLVALVTFVALALPSLPGCSNATGPDLSDGAPPVYSFVFPPQVVASAYELPAPSVPPATTFGVRLTNTGPTAATVEHGACSVSVWLYRADVRGGGPAWQNLLPANSACIAIAYVQTIAPGATYQVGGALLGTRTRGDSLPAGRYLVRVAIRHREAATAGERLVVLDGGTVDLP